MTLPFREATRIRPCNVPATGGPGEPASSAVFEADVPDQWQQGRGAFGGLVFGLLVRAACAVEPDPSRVLRSFSSDIAGPVLSGPVRLRVRVLRRGRSQSNLQAELDQGDETLAVAQLTLSGPRAIEQLPEVYPAAPLEAARPWREVAVVPVGPPLGPVFAHHYEYRNLGPLPLSRGGEAISAGFVRELPGLREPDAELDAAAITALLDTYWPAVYAVSPRPYPMTTVSFAAQYLAHGLVLPASEPLFFRARNFVHSEGYCVEFRELWARDKLVAMNQQTFAILR